jgi:bifunctional non-homologous end joining protein LigD
MLATLVDKPFDDPDWLFEIKWDGYRAISEVDEDVKLYSRRGLSLAEKYPEIVSDLEKLGHQAVLDGEVVVIDKSGKSNFQYLQNYGQEKQGRLLYYIFDLLYLNGFDLRAQPLSLRKEFLKKIMPKKSRLKYSDHIWEKGIAFFNTATAKGLEGIMAKNSLSKYKEGVRTEDWLKIKTHKRQEAVIAGFTEPKGGRKYFGSLVLGVYDDKGELKYVGHTGTGFNQKSLKYIYDKLKPLVTNKSPFAKPPKTNAPVTWVKPKLVVEVEFTEWTADGQMRHPSFKGLREDKSPKEVHREKEKLTKKVL